MTLVKIDEHNFFTALTIGSAFLLLVLVVAGAVLISVSFAVGTATGGLIAMANGLWLRRNLERTMQLPVSKAVRYTWVRYLIRLGVITLVTSLLIVYGNINIFGLLLGLSVLVLTIMAAAVFLAAQQGG